LDEFFGLTKTFEDVRWTPETYPMASFGISSFETFVLLSCVGLAMDRSRVLSNA